MLSLSCCFLKGSVTLLSSKTKYEAIHELIWKNAALRELVRNKSDFEAEVIRREKVQSTGFGHGVAVAHGRFSEIDSVIMALGISQEGIPFDSIDKKPVHLLFLIASPPEQQDEYLTALSALVKLLRKEDFRSQIITHQTDPKAIRDMIRTRFCDQLSRETGYCP
jgi:PTS system nitrogen regulatory IIA component